MSNGIISNSKFLMTAVQLTDHVTEACSGVGCETTRVR